MIDCSKSGVSHFLSQCILYFKMVNTVMYGSRGNTTGQHSTRQHSTDIQNIECQVGQGKATPIDSVLTLTTGVKDFDHHVNFFRTTPVCQPFTIFD